MDNLFKNNKFIWLSWHKSVRSRNLAKILNIPIYEYFEDKNLLSRHLFSSLWTVKFIVKNRPRIVIIHYSFMLQLILVLYKILLFGRVKIISDCHTKALRRESSVVVNWLFSRIKQFSFKYVNLTVITNVGMVKDIKKLCEHYIIVPDKIPENKITKVESNERYIVNISAFAVDEPFDEIFKVAELLPQDITLYWTGKLTKNKILPSIIPKNIVFTGFISFEEYNNLIGNADCLIALTTEEDCLQSGAYEALNVEVPMVISDTKALRDYFADAAIYTNHSPQNIVKNIFTAFDRSKELMQNIRDIKDLRNKEFYKKIETIYEYIQ